MENKSSFGIIGVLVFAAIIFLIIKFWWLLLIIGALLIVFIILLVASSKKTKGSSSDMENQIRENLSNVRKQIFKAENTVRNAELWINEAINATYAKVLDNKYTAGELLSNYANIKEQYATQIPQAEVDKTDNVVKGYQVLIDTEKQKTEMLTKLQNEYNQLRDKLKALKASEKNQQQLDKHISRINTSMANTGAEEQVIKSNYTFDDLKSEFEYKQEYLKQLEELKFEYGGNVDINQINSYKNALDGLKSK